VGSVSEAASFNLSLSSFSERNAEHSEDVTIDGLGLHKCLNKGVPLFDHGACLVSGDVHSIEVGVAVESLNFIALELERSPGLVVGLVVAISEGDSEDSVSQAVSGVLLTGGFVTWGKSDASLIKSWGKDFVPFFSHKWMGTIR